MKTPNTIWIAYSGGVDSHVLLDIVSRNHTDVRAVHINHGLSPNAGAWEHHCQQVCAALDVPFTSIKVDARPKAGQSPEDAARVARYNAWQQLVEANAVILTAHHADDQAETILYRLFRGTGPKGLGGMQPKVIINGVTIIRPMLELSKADILTYAQERKLMWITDESNLHNNFDRNFIRNAIMPLLQDRWNSVAYNINRAGELCATLVNNIETDDVLDLDFWQNEVLRAWLAKHKLNPSAKQLSTIVNEVINAQPDAQPQFILGNKVIRRSRNKLYVLDHKVATHKPAHGRKAKKIFQQFGIPPWERAGYDLVFDDGKLVEIVDLWRST